MIFKKKKKRPHYDLVNENGMYKLYDNDKLIIWGTDLLEIMNYMKENN